VDVVVGAGAHPGPTVSRSAETSCVSRSIAKPAPTCIAGAPFTGWPNQPAPM
jgi:hypothetical protein